MILLPHIYRNYFLPRFAINLQCGTDEGADIMYHFNPRFGDNVLVCNSRCADSWGDEERLEGLPIGPGDQFTLCIVAAKEGYQPILNGNPLTIFPHRLDMSAACSILIDGDIRLLDLTVDCPPVSVMSYVFVISIMSLQSCKKWLIQRGKSRPTPLPGHSKRRKFQRDILKMKYIINFPLSQQ